MAQNNNKNNVSDFDASRQTTGSAATTGSTGTINSSATTGTIGNTAKLDRDYNAGTPSRDAGVQTAAVGTTERFNEGRTSYQPPRSEVTVTERRTSAKPSATAVIGSAVAAAVVGGAVPFMLAARKSRQSEDVSVHQRSRTPQTLGQDGFDDDRSPRERSSSDYRR